MDRKHCAILLVAFLVFGCARPGRAQHPFELGSWSLEARGEVARATGSFRSALDLGTGYGFGLAARYWLGAARSVYWGWDRFRFDGEGTGVRSKVVDSGVRLGLQVGTERFEQLDPFLLGGLVLNRSAVTQRSSSTRLDFAPDRSAGYEVGGGVMIPVTDGVWAAPEVRYRSHPNRDLPLAAGGEDVRASYFAFNFGLYLRLER